MTDGGQRRTDFFEPVRGWRIWRRGAGEEIDGGKRRDAERERPAAVVHDHRDTPPDFVEPVVAWRVWRVVKFKQRFFLASVMNNVVWMPGDALDARCLAFIPTDRHRSPHPACHCGVYASTRDSVDWRLAMRRALLPVAVGKVHLWGSVIEAERGWRAEHAYPGELFVPTVGSKVKDREYRVAESLEDYGVPVSTVLVERVESLPSVVALLAGEPGAAASLVN